MAHALDHNKNTIKFLKMQTHTHTHTPGDGRRLWANHGTPAQQNHTQPLSVQHKSTTFRREASQEESTVSCPSFASQGPRGGEAGHWPEGVTDSFLFSHLLSQR